MCEIHKPIKKKHTSCDMVKLWLEKITHILWGNLHQRTLLLWQSGSELLFQIWNICATEALQQSLNAERMDVASCDVAEERTSHFFKSTFTYFLSPRIISQFIFHASRWEGLSLKEYMQVRESQRLGMHPQRNRQENTGEKWKGKHNKSKASN